MIRENRFWGALAVFALIAVLEWYTLEGRIRWVALAVLALFTVRTVVHEQRRQLEQKIDNERSRE